MLGTRVIITSSSNEKLARAKALSGDEKNNYAELPDWGRRAHGIAGDQGSDIVVDVAGLVNRPPGPFGPGHRRAGRRSGDRQHGARSPARGNAPSQPSARAPLPLRLLTS